VKGPRGQSALRTAPRDNREAILDAAARTIARRGVRGLRVEDVASEAGVSAALLYYHFESRSGLVRAALEHASEQAPSTALRNSAGVRADDAATGYEAVEKALLAELDEEPTVRDNAIVWGEVSATAVFEPDLRDDVRRVTEAWREAVAAGIRAGIADGSIRGDVDPEESAELLIVLVDGLCTRWLAAATDTNEARRLLRAALAGTLRPFGAD
jgi:AcrR family transcriptional regulator